MWRVNVNSRDQKGWTPVQIAAFHGFPKIVSLLLEHGADPRMKNAYNKDAFALAAEARPTSFFTSRPGVMRWCVRRPAPARST